MTKTIPKTIPKMAIAPSLNPSARLRSEGFCFPSVSFWQMAEEIISVKIRMVFIFIFILLGELFPFFKGFWRFLFQISSCSCSDWISNDGNFLTHFDLTEKCCKFVLAGNLTHLKISRKNCWKCTNILAVRFLIFFLSLQIVKMVGLITTGIYWRENLIVSCSMKKKRMLFDSHHTTQWLYVFSDC